MSKLRCKFTLKLYDMLEVIYPEKELNEFVSDYFEGEHGIEMGVITASELEDYMIDVIDNWCYRIDNKCNATQDGMPLYSKEKIALFKSQRGCSYYEYCILYKGIPREKFSQHPAILAFGIGSEYECSKFTHRHEMSKQTFLQLFKKYFPKVYFYLSSEPRAVIPMNDLMSSHCWCIATTGAGKSYTIMYEAYGIMRDYPHISIVVIDPHGELAKGMKQLSLNKNYKSVVYFDPSLKEGYAPTINPLLIHDKSRRTVTFTGEQLITTLKDIFSSDEESKLSGVMVNTLEKCIYFLLRRESKTTLLELRDLLRCDPLLLKEAQEYDPMVFNAEFAKGTNTTRKALLDRIDRLLNPPLMGPLLSGDDTFDLEDAMDTGKLVLFNLGALPEQSRNIFGKFLIAQIKSIMWKREDRPQEQRRHVFLIVDEFQNFVVDGVEQMLSQMRKYNLRLILANQYIEQISNTKLKHAVIGNTRIKIVGAASDPATARELGGAIGVDAKEILNLPDYEYFIKTKTKLYRVRIPDTLLTDKTKRLTEKQLKELDDYQIEHYYKLINDKRSTTDTLPKPKYDIW